MEIFVAIIAVSLVVVTSAIFVEVYDVFNDL
jgi:hypothetical protein